MPVAARLNAEESRLLAKQIVEELMHRLSDDEDVAMVVGAWGKYLDRWLGKTFRRFLVLVVMAATGAAAIKFKIWTHLGG